VCSWLVTVVVVSAVACLQERTQLSATLEEERTRSSSEVARLTLQAQAAQQQAAQLQTQVGHHALWAGCVLYREAGRCGCVVDSSQCFQHLRC
jgi:hypothetical protein